MIKISVHVHDILRDRLLNNGEVKIGPDGCFDLHLPDRSKVHDLISRLELEKELIGLVIVNGRQASEEQDLQKGDKIKLLSPMSGG